MCDNELKKVNKGSQFQNRRKVLCARGRETVAGLGGDGEDRELRDG